MMVSFSLRSRQRKKFFFTALYFWCNSFERLVQHSYQAYFVCVYGCVYVYERVYNSCSVNSDSSFFYIYKFLKFSLFFASFCWMQLYAVVGHMACAHTESMLNAFRMKWKKKRKKKKMKKKNETEPISDVKSDLKIHFSVNHTIFFSVIRTFFFNCVVQNSKYFFFSISYFRW